MKAPRRPLHFALSLIVLLLACAPNGAAQKVSLSRTSLDFGGQAVNKTSAALNVIVTNADNSIPLAIAVVASGGYSETDNCNGLIAPSGICTLQVTFTPNTSGTLTGVVTLNDDANNSPQLISLKGVGVVPLTVAPASLTFPTVPVGSSSSAQTVTVTNNLSSSLNMNFKASGDYGVSAKGATPCGASLAGQASCTLAVQFKPTEAGAINGALTITQNVNSTPQIVTLTGTGSGGSTPPLTFKPSSLSFGSVGAGASSAKTVVVTNNSSQTVTISAISTSGDYTAVGGSSSPCGGALTAGNQCTISVSFKPTSAATINGAVSITDNSSVKTQVLNASGKGIAPFTLSPTALSFAKEPNGSTSPAQTVTLTNHLKTALNISGIVVSADYGATNTCGSSVAASSSCTISVTFSPIARTGAIPGTLTVTSNAGSSPQVVELTGSSSGKLPRFAYVANAGENTVSMYTVDVHTGQLRANGYVLTGLGPVSIALTPSDKFAYVANYFDNTLHAYQIDANNGRLTELSSSPTIVGETPLAVNVDPTGKFAYVTNNLDGTVSAYTINSSTGALSTVSGSPFLAGDGPQGLTIHPSGKFAYVGNTLDNTVSAYQIDTGSGALTAVTGSPFSTDVDPQQIVIDPTGHFAYVSNAVGTVSAYSIDGSTGVLTAIPGSPFAAGMSPFAITVDQLGKYLFVGIGDPTQVSVYGVIVYSIAPGTGVLTQVPGSPFNVPQAPGGLTVDASNQFLGVAVQNADLVLTYAINPASGALALAQTVTGRSDPYAIAMTSGSTPVTYTPQFAYVDNSSDADVSAYVINPLTGDLSPVSGSPFAAGQGIFSSTVDPLGRFAYVTDAELSGHIFAFSINPATGALAAISGSPFTAGAEPAEIAIDPSDRFLYAVNFNSNNVSAYTINSSTGALSAISGSPFAAGAEAFPAAVDPSGQFLFVVNEQDDTISGYTIDSATGGLTPIAGSLPTTGNFPQSIGIDPSGRFAYVANSFDNTLSAYILDPGTGSLSRSIFGTPRTGEGPVSVAIDPSGRFAYVANKADNTISAYTVNSSTGALTPLPSSPFPAGNGPQATAVDPTGRFLYVANYAGNNVSVYAIDPSTGSLTELPGSPFAAGNGPVSVSISSRIH